MKKKKSSKNIKNKLNSSSNIHKEEDQKEEDIPKEIGTFHEFLIFEKSDKKNEKKYEFIKCDHDNPFLNDWLILQTKPEITQSRFSNLFKEINENNKKSENDEKIIDNINQSKLINNLENYNNKIELTKEEEIKDSNYLYSNTFPNTNSYSKERITPDYSYSNNFIPFFGQSFNEKNNSLYSTSSFFGSSTNDSLYRESFSNNSLININSYERKSDNYNTKNSFKNNFELVVDINRVISLEDKRTTVMIKNIPNKFNKDILLDIIDQNFKGTYDIFILPIDINKNRNYGYAFINFINSYFIPYFYFMFNGKKWSNTNSEKICEITYSNIQGKNNLIFHYHNKIVYQNNSLNVNNEQKYIIPNEYLLIFKQKYPMQFIEEYKFYFITKMPYEH